MADSDKIMTDEYTTQIICYKVQIAADDIQIDRYITGTIADMIKIVGDNTQIDTDAKRTDSVADTDRSLHG